MITLPSLAASMGVSAGAWLLCADRFDTLAKCAVALGAAGAGFYASRALLMKMLPARIITNSDCQIDEDILQKLGLHEHIDAAIAYNKAPSNLILATNSYGLMRLANLEALRARTQAH